ncbi:MAG: penicillin-binding protein, partial [Alphaproteobacteria bacterium]
VLRMQRDGLGRALVIADAETAEVDAEGEADDASPFAAGAALTLTIDAGLQALVERELAIGVADAKAVAGTAVLLDPRTGEVVALANVPSYDPNKPGAAGPGARRNRAVTDAFEPGSTLKAILMATALEERTMRPNDSVFCERGRYRIGKWTVHDHHPYGMLSMPEVIQFSSNIGVSKIAAGLGKERYGRSLERFGFGHRTAIDLPGEVAGIVRPWSSWAPIDLATGSFGQGLSVTPIQLAAAYGALANGGVLHQPHLLRRAVDRSGRVLLDRDEADQDSASRQVISPETARAVTAMLERVVEFEGGTGGKARMEGVRVAGKTGTAQKVDSRTGRYSRDRLASFVGFAPADDPAYVLLGMIDTPRTQTYGGLVAAPVFKEIMSRALDRLGERPASAVDAKPGKGERAGRSAKAQAKPAPKPAPRDLHPRREPLPDAAAILQQASMGGFTGIDGEARGGVPSFVGMSLRRALETAASEGLSIEEARGSGFVKAQDPPAGTPRYPGDGVVLLLEPSL